MSTDRRSHKSQLAHRRIILSDTESSCQELSALARNTQPGRPIIEARAEHSARLSSLAEFLPPSDRTLIRWVHQDGKSVAEIAGLLRVRRESLGRRIRALIIRCRAPEFAFVAAHSGSWPAPMAHVARACILEGRSVRSVATTLRMTVHAARTHRMVILSMARGVQQTHQPHSRQWRS